jgi:transposase
MVEQTLEPGASVAKVAQANGVNPNVLFLWRRQHREGRLAVQWRARCFEPARLLV